MDGSGREGGIMACINSLNPGAGPRGSGMGVGGGGGFLGANS